MDDNINKLHNCQMLLAGELSRICKKHSIKYFMIAGTLLGAVRHSGFIPWDDDMDFGMPREDYDKFMSVAFNELEEEFYIKTLLSSEGYAHPIAKMYLKNTIFVEENASKLKQKEGIYIDIFPFDNIPDDVKLQKKQSSKLYYLKRLLLAKLNYSIGRKGQIAKKTVYFVLKLMSLFTTEASIKKAINHQMTKYDGQATEKFAAMGGAYGYYKESVKREWFDETVLLPFEDISLPAPSKNKEYLTCFYGDYMTPPPEDKRYNRHSAKELDFGPYNN